MHWLTTLSVALAALAVATGSAAAAGAEPGVVIRGARVEALASGDTRVAIDLDQPIEPRIFLLEAPNRLVVDLPGARAAAAATAAGGLVQRVRQGQRPDGAVRLVFDLAARAEVAPAKAAPGPSGAVRLLIVLRAAKSPPPGGPAPAMPAVARAAPSRPAPVALPVSSSGRARVARQEGSPSSRQRTIVVDAGHGGHDPGAQGASGVHEKAVVLAAAMSLRSALEGRGYTVVLTRDGDRFLPLQERVAIARDNKADLFISLHADSNPSAQAKGATVYTLSERGNERAKGVMEAQDWDMDLGDTPHSAQVEKILVDLAQRETTNRSAEFAQALIRELSGDTPLLNRSHRNAGFFVLLAPDVPAVLLEMGFLTNAQDERRMTDAPSRRQMMNAVADAIDVYFARSRDYAGR